MRKIVILSLFVLILAIGNAAALEISIDVEDSFIIGDEIFFEYEITSDTVLDISYLSGIDCPDAPIIRDDPVNVKLESGAPYKNSHLGFSVNEFMEPQECHAFVEIVSPMGLIITENFSVNTPPSFVFDIKLDKKVFMQGEEVNIDFESNISGVEIFAVLKLPDDSTKELNLPQSIKAEQIGTYTLDVTASKTGYRKSRVSEQFGIIEKEPTFESEYLDASPAGFKIYKVIIILICVFVILLILVIYLLHRRKRMDVQTDKI